MSASAGHGAAPDATVETLTRLFRAHPVWRRAAGHIAPEAECAVYFRHLPGRPFRLVRRRGRATLVPGVARDPDFVLRFAPAAVERLARVRGDVGDFALELFHRALDRRAAARVDIRIAAPFARLVRRGYVRLLLAAGPRVLALGAAHGVRTLGELRALVARLRARRPARWETTEPGRK